MEQEHQLALTLQAGESLRQTLYLLRALIVQVDKLAKHFAPLGTEQRAVLVRSWNAVQKSATLRLLTAEAVESGFVLDVLLPDEARIVRVALTSKWD